MVFSSIPFLFAFLPITVLLTALAPSRARNYVLLAASIVFYAWGGGGFLLVLALCIAINYVGGLATQAALDAGDAERRKRIVAWSVVANIAILGWFKYANFGIAQLNSMSGALGIGEIPWNGIALPIGISFFTFQSMSYVIDVGRGRGTALKNPLDFALFVALFPQLIAGPIVRYHEIAKQMLHRSMNRERFAAGSIRFVWGLAKKVLVADVVATVADAAFSIPADERTFATAWLGLFAYSAQIYFDFSGYSDMAIGLGTIFGFDFPENFKRPYSALSITDFWRRWHITLSNWFRDYLYIPLGGSRGSEAKTRRNLIIVFLVTGLWHGANWTFIIWGAYHGVFLLLERATGQRALVPDRTAWFRRAYAFLVVCIGWVFFRSLNMTDAWSYLGSMVGLHGWTGLSATVKLVADHRTVATLLLAASTLAFPQDWATGLWLTNSRPTVQVTVARFATVTVVFVLAIVAVMSSSFSPFLYFQF